MRLKLTLITLLFLMIFIVPINSNVTIEGKQVMFVSSDYEKHAPISIESDNDFVNQGWSGNGTEKNPYVIENIFIDLNASENIDTFNAIYIENTQSYFIIKDCEFQGRFSETRDLTGMGIHIWHVENVKIINCSFRLFAWGIETLNVSNCEIRDNYFNGYKYKLIPTTLLNLGGFAILIQEFCDNFIIENNVFEFYGNVIRTHGLINSNITGNHLYVFSDGIIMSDWNFDKVSRNCVLKDNIIEWGWLGIGLADCTELIVENNTINNNGNGIWLSERVTKSNLMDNILTDNGIIYIQLNIIITDDVVTNIIGTPLALAEDSIGYGILTSDGSIDNNITENTFINNGVNVIDDTGNFYDYNYWSDYTGYDVDGDGIGDTPYDVAGLSGSRDYHPKGIILSSTIEIDILLIIVILGGIGIVIVISYRVFRKK